MWKKKHINNVAVRHAESRLLSFIFHLRPTSHLQRIFRSAMSHEADQSSASVSSAASPESDEEEQDEVNEMMVPVTGEERPHLARKRYSRLSVEGSTIVFDIPTDMDAQVFAEETHGRDSWQMKTLRFLHRRDVQIFLLILLLLDILVIFAEVYLMSEYPHCGIIQRDAISCCPPTNTAE